MRADRDTFIDQIRQFDTDTLLSLAVSLYVLFFRLKEHSICRLFFSKRSSV